MPVMTSAADLRAAARGESGVARPPDIAQPTNRSTR
jgi:hypothetical protein